MAVSVNEVRFAFQPLYSLHTGSAVAVEALARPATCSLRALLAQAHSTGQLVETDLSLAVRAVKLQTRNEALLPLHVNILAPTVAEPDALGPLTESIAHVGRRPKDVVLEIGSPFSLIEPSALLDGLEYARGLGFGIAFDGLGVADLPLAVLAAAPANMYKVDRSILARLPGDAASEALLEGLLHFAGRADARVVATGIARDEELSAAQDLGIRYVQGSRFGDSPRLSMQAVVNPVTTVTTLSENNALTTTSAPSVIDFLRPAATLSADATCEQARQALVAKDAVPAMVGIDTAGRPQWTIDRSRFLLGLSGRYGHALHANKPARQFADRPHTVPDRAGTLELLDRVAGLDADRMYDDLVVVDPRGRCRGVVRVAEVVRGVADMKIAEAATLNPLTRLPSSDTIAKDITHRINAEQPFVAACLDVDGFRQVNMQAGFAAGDELIRALGRTLTNLVAQLPHTTVSHIGSDEFLLAADPDELGTLAPALLDTPWSAGGINVHITLAGLVCSPRTVTSYADVSRMLAGLRQHSKKLTGNNWVLGRPGVDRVDVVRGRDPQPSMSG